MRRKLFQNPPAGPGPVEKIELSEEKPSKLRIALMIFFVAVAVFAITYGTTQLIARQGGWTEIKVPASSTDNCAADFELQYDVPKGTVNAFVRGLTEVYTALSERGARVFDPRKTYDGLANLAQLNLHPNEELAVEPELYRALSRIVEAGDRSIYLAPLYDYYENLFRCTDDSAAREFDPARSSETAAEFEAVMQYVRPSRVGPSDPLSAVYVLPAQVWIELPAEGRAILHVSDDYLAFAAEHGIDAFADFYWMKNAFLIDEIAEGLKAAGYTNGYLTSREGCLRVLDARESSFTLYFYTRTDNEIDLPQVLTYSGPMSAVSLRDYPLSVSLADYYYEFRDGAILTPYLDAKDGREKVAAHELMLFGREAGCADLLLAALPVYIADAPLDTAALEALASGSVYAMFAADGSVRSTDGGALMTPKDPVL